MSDAPQAPREGWRARLWRRPAAPWLLGIPLGAFVALFVGAGGIVAFVGAIELSRTETFCVSRTLKQSMKAGWEGLGLAGVALAYFYHAASLRLSYRGLGELAVMVTYGPPPTAPPPATP